MGNKPNYQKELDQILTLPDNTGRRLFLHSCCAPCSSWVLTYLRDYFRITVYYYNPNITDRSEYGHRKEEQLRFIDELNKDCGKDTPPFGIDWCDADYDPKEFYDISKGLEDVTEGGSRCRECFKLRLFNTAHKAAEGNFDYFCTTLTISPLKNAEVLNQVGQEAAAKYGVKFLPSDFKKKEGYKKSIELSNEYGLYRQDYCGCEFSKRKDHS